jgi:serine/threonine protein kinase
LINAEGDCKLVDFSIAEKKKSGLGKLFGGKKTAQGTRSYMSPEQIRCEPLDERTDVYSFGCVLYEALVGKPPYTGSTPQELLNKHMTAPPPSGGASKKELSAGEGG